MLICHGYISTNLGIWTVEVDHESGGRECTAVEYYTLREGEGEEVVHVAGGNSTLHVAGGNSTLNPSNTMETYRIHCFIPGPGEPFSVEIEKTQVTHRLKRLIKEEISPTLDHLPTNSLELYQVLIDRSSDLEQRIKVLNDLYLNKEGAELAEDEELSKYFGENPPEGLRYYVIVRIPKLQIPKRESIYCRHVVHRSGN